MEEVLVSIATGALAILVTLIAIVLALKLLGKLAKFVIILVLLALGAWLIFSDASFLRDYISLAAFLPSPHLLFG